MADSRHPVPLRARAEPAEVEVLDGPPPGWPRPGLLAAAGHAVGRIGRALLPALPRASAAALVRVADGSRGALDQVRSAVAQAAATLGQQASGTVERASTAAGETLGRAGAVMERLRARLAPDRRPTAETEASRTSNAAAPPPGDAPSTGPGRRRASAARAESVIASLRQRLGSYH